MSAPEEEVPVWMTRAEIETAVDLIEDTWRGSDTWGYPLEQAAHDRLCLAIGREPVAQIDVRRAYRARGGRG